MSLTWRNAVGRVMAAAALAIALLSAACTTPERAPVSTSAIESAGAGAPPTVTAVPSHTATANPVATAFPDSRAEANGDRYPNTLPRPHPYGHAGTNRASNPNSRTYASTHACVHGDPRPDTDAVTAKPPRQT